MRIATAGSVVSGALVVAALSSATVQLQTTHVLVSPVAATAVAAAGVPAEVPAEMPSQVAAEVPAAPLLAAPARPVYVTPSAGRRLVVRPAGGRATVDVLGCSAAWSASGQCRGVQAAVVRQAAVREAGTALRVPAGVAHLRVSVAGGEVAVAAAP